jgi:hypothetical protein
VFSAWRCSLKQPIRRRSQMPFFGCIRQAAENEIMLILKPVEASEPMTPTPGVTVPKETAITLHCDGVAAQRLFEGMELTAQQDVLSNYPLIWRRAGGVQCARILETPSFTCSINVEVGSAFVDAIR